ncbi:MAG: radical SAM protein [Selenomonadaceae bacterium]|nr:radical SAM protein [Selenomonadaceae bacterium]
MQIILKLTTACNLNCSYCSEGDRAIERMPEDIFYKLVDELPALLDHVGKRNAEFLFHGGEPLLYGRDGLKRLIDYARAQLSTFDIQFLMQTNGTLIDDDWIEFLKAQDIHVGISLDGYPDIHDQFRRTKDDRPTAALIVDNIKRLREAGLSVGTLMVLNSAVDADKLFDFIREHNLHPKIHPVIACGRAQSRNDVDELYDVYTAVMKRLLERSLELDDADVIEPLDEIINAILELEPIHECAFNGSCGREFICLYPDGEAGFCGRDNYARHLSYGSLRDRSLVELYESANAKKIRARQEYLRRHDCAGCSDWELCHGGCAFEAVNACGVLESKYPNCLERKKFIEWLRTEGLKMLKAALVRAKTRRRKSLEIKKQLRSEIEDL